MKRTVEENRLRSERYRVVKEATGSSVLARKARDHKLSKIAKISPKIRVNETKRIVYIYVPVKREIKKEPVLTKKQLKNLKKQKRYKQLRDLNYTPDEAKKLRGVSDKKFKDILEKRTIFDKSGRAKRWANMSGTYKNGKKKKFDRKIVEACENINIEYGYDIDSRFGWAVYYFYYINGGTIEGWTKYVDQDPFVAHMVTYNLANQFQF